VRDRAEAVVLQLEDEPAIVEWIWPEKPQGRGKKAQPSKQ
jgi:hypothetical protein